MAEANDERRTPLPTTTSRPRCGRRWSASRPTTSGVDEHGHKKEKGHGPDTHGPLGGVHMHRRKAGGGGA